MANAAAKKAALARQSATTIYTPLLLTTTTIYLLLRILYHWSTLSKTHCFFAIGLVSLTYVAHQGICEDYANRSSMTTYDKKTEGGSGDKLAGGAWLDLLGLVLVVQFGSVLWSDSFYWLLGVLPLWGGWKALEMYRGVSGGGGGGGLFGGGNGGKTTEEGEGEDEDAKERRRKRAEKRRMKWS